MLEDYIPSLFIVDLALPGMDGWSFLREIQSRPELAEVPSVAVTAYHATSVAQQAIEAGFTAYFPKPFQPQAFIDELSRILET